MRIALTQTGRFIMATGRFRPRKEFKFWLFHDIAEDVRLMEFIQFCKSKRKFASVIRSGIRLMWSLGEGDTSVLFELFPTLKSELIHVKDLPPPPPAPDNSKLEREIAELKKLILEQGNIQVPPKDYPSMKPAALPPTVQAKAAPIADAGAIADNFLAFIQ